MNYLIDTSAWIEYFIGSARGERLRQILEHPQHHIYLLHSTLAEFYAWCLKNAEPFEPLNKVILSRSTLLSITLPDWLRAVEQRIPLRAVNKKIGILDVLLIVKQEQCNAKIVTCDSDFRHSKKVLFL